MAVIVVVPIMVASAVWYYTAPPSTALSHPTERTASPVQSYAAEWDPRVKAIAEFVASERGLSFKQPVNVDFLTAAQYHDAVLADHNPAPADGQPGASGSGMTDDEVVAQFRALGLVSGKADLGAAGDTLADSGTLAFYSPYDKRVRVRGSELTPELRVTLAHELTHALQDQYFDLADGRGAQPSTFRPIIEGDAVRIEYAYEATVLTDAERKQEAASHTAGRRAYEALLATSDVPSVFSTAFELPYAVGPQFVEINAAMRGNAAVDALIRRPPTSEVSLLDPLRAGVDSTVTTVAPPAVPTQAEALDREPMGAGMLFLLLGEHIEPAAAFDAASSWQGEASVVFRLHGVICFDARFVTTGSNDALLAGMTAWASAMPAEAGARVWGTNNEVNVHTCDPGADAAYTVAGRTEQTLTYAAIRSEIELELVRDAHMTNARSSCVADTAARTISAADLASADYDATADPELMAALRRVTVTC
jgi:hypothetical protein